MSRSLNVYLLPSLVAPDALAGRTAVVIDVLRATTTIVTALAAGATAVVPCGEIDEAKSAAAKHPGGALLGGERGGLRIPGFDLGNSPAEYGPDVVRGKIICFTTTNGTRALARCQQAGRVFIGAFVNFSALCDALRDEVHIDLVCAGTDNVITREDVLLAGAIVADLLSSNVTTPLNDQALIALDAWRAADSGLRGSQPLAAALRDSRGGRNLIEIGHERDIDIAAQIDRYAIVPQWNMAAGTITSAPPK